LRRNVPFIGQVSNGLELWHAQTPDYIKNARDPGWLFETAVEVLR